MNATVEVRINKDLNALRTTVPLASILSDGSSTFIWLLNEDTMTVTKREVTVEPGVGETLVITSGLNPEQRIVGAGAAYLSEGMSVREWE